MKRKNSTITCDTSAKHQKIEDNIPSPSPDFWPSSPIEYSINDPVDFWPLSPTEINDIESGGDNDVTTPSNEVRALIAQTPSEDSQSQSPKSGVIYSNDQEDAEIVASLPFFSNAEGTILYVGDSVAYKEGNETLVAARILDINLPNLPSVDPQLQELIFVQPEGWGPEHAKMVTQLDIKACPKDAKFGPNGRDDSKSWQDYRKQYSSEEGRRARLHTGVVFDDAMLLHDCPCVKDRQLNRHPERPERCVEIMAKFETLGLLRKVKRLRSRMATKDELESCHLGQHVVTYFGSKPYTMPGTIVKNGEDWAPPSLKDKMLCGELGISCDTTYNPYGTPNAARMAAGSVIEMMDAVVSGRVVNGFAIVRPPGHHAEQNHAMCCSKHGPKELPGENQKSIDCRLGYSVSSFVLFLCHNDYLIKQIGLLKRSHGNGTQSLFYGRNDVLYISLHRYDNGLFYPYSGPTTDLGTGEGLGNNVNITFSSEKDRFESMGDIEYLAAFKYIVMPIARQYNPDLVIVSAGFDAAEGHEDAIGGYKITPRGFAYMTQMLKNLANGKLVLALEGGYALESLSESACACLSAMLGPDLSPIEQYKFNGGLNTVKPNQSAVTSLQKVVAILKNYWNFPATVTDEDFRFALPADWRATNSLSTRPKRTPKPKKRLPVEG
ncbi:1716_t:CDS:10 [Diversispora eburnea]|uniref:histone deacetylase n=1 Tax=Diversispora eburnea TaxID=1213867 RepID=A0A9N8V8H4_9GLOM|nr:1716_t:CDS:10 [Diversispora eburnea]